MLQSLKFGWMYNKIWFGHFGILMTPMIIIQPINHILALLMRRIKTVLGFGYKKDGLSIWNKAADGALNSIVYEESYSFSI